MPDTLRIGIAGLGTVGTGCVKILQTHASTLAARAGQRLQITAVSARDKTKDRGIDLSSYGWETDPVALAARDDVDLLIEVIGGENGPAKDAVETALAGGKHVVTANKSMLSRHGTDLAKRSEAAHVALRFEAAVAGGIPCVKALTEGLAANAMTRVMGVLNGTCNYILTEMERSGANYQDVLGDAQRLGYAEADPTFDVGGIDAAQKLALLAATAYGAEVDVDGVMTTGIESITLNDISHARDMGYVIKLLGVARLTGDGLEQRMHPCLVPMSSPFGQLDGVTNMVVFEGDQVGRTVFEGPGAGEGPTASAVVADVIDIARGVRVPAFGVPAVRLTKATRSMAGSAAAYYVRLTLEDKPGTLAKVAAILGDHQISIHRMRQYDHSDNRAPVLIVTHETTQQRLDVALSEIERSDVSLAAPVALRIEAL